MSPDADLPDPSPPSAPVAEALAADQSAAHATSSHRHYGPFHTHCENCGAKLEGPWCHACGQHDFEFHRSFRHVFFEALESFFHFEGKFFRNIIVLLFQPGRLTAEFNAGKRASQMPPFRLYVFVSLLFFFLLYAGSDIRANLNFGTGAALTRDGETILGRRTELAPPPATDAPPAVQQIMREAGRDLEREQNPHRALERLREAADQVAETINSGASSTTGTAATPTDSPAPRPRPTPKAETALEKDLVERARHAMTPEGQAHMVQVFLTALPKMLLFCLPFFALFTRILFARSGQVYLQHLVLALHFHTFIYLFILFRDGWAFLGDLTGLGLGGWIRFFARLWMIVYPFMMLRRLFGNSWPATILKTFVLFIAYGATLTAGFLITLTIVVLLL